MQESGFPNTVESVEVWYDGKGEQERIDYYDGMDQNFYLKKGAMVGCVLLSFLKLPS